MSARLAPCGATAGDDNCEGSNPRRSNPGKRKRSSALTEDLWQREKDSNPHKQSQSLSCYPYTIPLNCTRSRKRRVYYSRCFWNVKGIFKKITVISMPAHTVKRHTVYLPRYSAFSISAISSGVSLHPSASHILIMALIPLRKNSI